MKQSIIVLLIYITRTFAIENSAKETFSNFQKQQLAILLLFLITYLINKLTDWQWVLLWVPPLEMHFCAIVKKEWLDNCSIHFQPMICKRYINVIFVFYSSKEHLQSFVNYRNKQHKCLKFTSEAKNDTSFSFLNIKIARHNQQFKTSAYRKPTFSGVFTHYESYLDQTYKKPLIDTFLSRCFSICSDYTLFIWKLKF